MKTKQYATPGPRRGGRAAGAGPASTARARPRPAVGVIGLGIMGSAMAANLVAAGFQVHGCDLRAAPVRKLRRAGGVGHAHIAGVAQACRYFILSLPSAAALAAVARELALHGRKGSVAAELSTLPIEAKEQARAALEESGIVLLDCPVSGTGAQAAAGDLSVYASGDPKAIRRMAPVFKGFARERHDVGAFGQGMRMKLVANLLVAIHNVSTAEAMLLGTRMGLDAQAMLRALGDGAGGSRMLQVRGPMMAGRAWRQATMKLDVWRKDMRLIGDELDRLSVPAPLFSAAGPVYRAALALGHGPHDTAAVYDVLERWAAPVQGPPPAGRRPAGAKKNISD